MVNRKIPTTQMMKNINYNFLFFLLSICIAVPAFAQTDDTVIDYSESKEYEIGGIKVTGAEYSDENALISIAGFKVGDKVTVPGTEIPRAMKSLWRLRLFTDIQIYKEKTIGDIIFLEIAVSERPQLSRHSFRGVKKTYHEDLNEIVNKYLLKGAIVTESLKNNAEVGIQDFFKEKGFLDVKVNAREIPDKAGFNKVKLEFKINRGEKVKIQEIAFSGNKNVKDSKLRAKMDATKRKRKIFSSSKYLKDEYKLDKEKIITYYNTLGFRDAKITNDSVYRNADGRLNIEIALEEGNRYFFRNIIFKGNSIYKTDFLETILGIKKGDVYDTDLLNTRLNFSPDGRDVSTQYLDNGYLFFQVNPVEVAIVGDSIDLELRIFEGPQATIDKVSIAGNDRTHEHVIRRELRTKPGQKFSRTDIVRSQREIINLGYFNPEALGINTPVNAQRGTVDIEYTVEEKPSDQLELSAGWGGVGRGVIGTLGVSFNNFSLRNIFNRETWSPLPQGDGQRLSLRAQTNGRFFQSYNASFTEPWLGGKKPNSFTVGGFLTRITNGQLSTSDNFQLLSIASGSVGLGTRLKWPDDNFVSNTTLTYQLLSLRDWATANFGLDDGTFVMNGKFNNISINQTIARSTINEPIFPTSGSRFSLSVQLTPPYSAFNGGSRNFSEETPQERFRFVEYHKWRFNAEWFTKLVGNLTLRASAKIGMLGAYNRDLGTSPFERFVLGGDGLANQQGGLLGFDLISLRGYEEDELPNSRNGGAAVFDKFTVEIRYPLSLNPSATIYVLGFFEGGNSWNSFRQFNPFDLRRSAGLGVRVFLPMFGTLGFDYGLGFDKPGLDPANGIFNNFGNFNIILGFEPE